MQAGPVTLLPACLSPSQLPFSKQLFDVPAAEIQLPTHDHHVLDRIPSLGNVAHYYQYLEYSTPTALPWYATAVNLYCKTAVQHCWSFCALYR